MMINFPKTFMLLMAFLFAGCGSGDTEGTRVSSRPKANIPVTAETSLPAIAAAPQATSTPTSGTGSIGNADRAEVEESKKSLALYMSKDPTGYSAWGLLMVAAEDGEVTKFKAFKEWAAAKDLKEQAKIIEGTTAISQNLLHMAAKNGRTDVVRLILTWEKDLYQVLDRADLDGQSPLALSVKHGHVETVKAFFESFSEHDKKLELFIKNMYGKSLLDMAAENGKADVVEYLSGLRKALGMR